MSEFKLHAPYQPTGDQPQAIEALVKGVKKEISFRRFWVSPVPARHLPWRM